MPLKPLPKLPDYDNAVAVENLTFAYTSSKDVLHDLDLQLHPGSRTLLIGANGAGKSTLLRILAGRHLTKGKPPVKVLGLDAFHDTRLNFHRAYLDCDWGMRTVAFVGSAVPLMADIAVCDMMKKLQESYPERREELIEMLGIDVNWRMHQLSDGQRRRVQIFLGLVRPFHILLLDEVTTSLDVCVRQDLLRWLVKESEERNATILYATHIFDGLNDWPTNLYYLTDAGKCGWQGKREELPEPLNSYSMLQVAEHWLRKELVEKRKRKTYEKPHGKLDFEASELMERSQGGYSSGRLETDEERTARLIRHGRLSDIMGNKGVLEKVHRTAK